MHSSSSKRRLLLRRVAAYLLMTGAVVALSTVLVLLMLGYRFNRYDGTIQQGGLVQFITQPSGADVFVGDIQLANRTRSKITLNPGDYQIRMQRSGYQTWQKNVTVKAGTVLWLNSARLVPEKPVTTSVLSLPSVASTSVRPGVDYFAVLEKSTVPSVSLVDIDGDSISRQTLRLAAGQYHAAKKHRFVLGDWLGDHRVLVKHAYGGTQEWIVVDVNDVEKSYTIGVEDGVKPIDVIVDPRASERVLVLRSDGSVSLENVVSGEKQMLPVKNVIEMTADDDTLFYTAKPDKKSISTNYLTLGKMQARRLSTYPSKASVHLAGGKYFDVRHVATTIDKSVLIVKAKSWPDSDSQEPLRLETVRTVALSSGATAVDFKSQGRLVIVGKRTSQLTYDLELGIESDVSIMGAKGQSVRQPEWIDTFHYWSDAGGQMRQYEFDGTNQADITDVAPGFSAVYSSNHKYLYTIGKTDDGYRLQRTKMIVD